MLEDQYLFQLYSHFQTINKCCGCCWFIYAVNVHLFEHYETKQNYEKKAIKIVSSSFQRVQSDLYGFFLLSV